MTDITKLRKEIGMFFNALTNKTFTDSRQIEIISMLQELEQYYQDKLEQYKEDHEAISNYRTQFVEYNKKITKLKKINLMLETDNGDLSVKLEKLEKENSELHIKTDFLETEKEAFRKENQELKNEWKGDKERSYDTIVK